MCSSRKICAFILALAVGSTICSLFAQGVYDPVDLRFQHFFRVPIEPGYFVAPEAIDEMKDGRYVLLSGTTIYICDQSLQCSEFGSVGSELGEFGLDMSGIHPSDLAVDGRDRIVVADKANWRIQVCSEQGDCTAFGREGNARPDFDQIGTFYNPNRVEVDDQGRLWVGSDAYHRVQICTIEGDCRAFGEPLQLCGSQACIESSTYKDLPYGLGGLGFANVDDQGRVFLVGEHIYICDQSELPRCEIFSSSGGGDSLDGFVTTRMDSDAQGRLYLADAIRGRIHNCNVETGRCRSAGSRGYGPGQFEMLGDIHIRDDGLVSVVEFRTSRVQLFATLQPSEFLVHSGLNGAWYNPDTDGQGFFITVYQDLGLLFLGWFTYETEPRDESAPRAIIGDRFHRWLTAQGTYDGNAATLDVTMTSGGIFEKPKEVVNTEPGEYGTISIKFHDCSSATVKYELLNADRVGEMPITRIVPDNARVCEIMDFE